MAVLEVCCYSVACARQAERYGADRIELCAAPQEGGLTPSYGVLVSAREAITLRCIRSFARAAAISATPRKSSPRCLTIFAWCGIWAFPGW